MSRHGETRLRDQGLDPLYVPHGIRTEHFHPYDKAEARAECKLPQDAFICGMVAANKGNPSRKAFVENLQAFKRLHDEHEEALLYLHTMLTGRFGGVDLPHLIDFLGIDRKAVVFCDQYRALYYPFPAATLAKLYSSMDVLMAASYGEGLRDAVRRGAGVRRAGDPVRLRRLAGTVRRRMESVRAPVLHAA